MKFYRLFPLLLLQNISTASEFTFLKEINNKKYIKIISNVKYKYKIINKIIHNNYENNVIFDSVSNLKIFNNNTLLYFKEQDNNKNLFLYLDNMKNLYSKIILLSNKNIICLKKSKNILRLNKCNLMYEKDLDKYYTKYKDKMHKNISKKHMKMINKNYEYFLQNKKENLNIDLIKKLEKEEFKKEWYQKEKNRLYSDPYIN
jgi:hypothetical protein